jgi:hypothetical protein
MSLLPVDLRLGWIATVQGTRVFAEEHSSFVS